MCSSPLARTLYGPINNSDYKLKFSILCETQRRWMKELDKYFLEVVHLDIPHTRVRISFSYQLQYATC
jgi:hypothetical protein